MGNLINFFTSPSATQVAQANQTDSHSKPSEALAIGAFLSFFKDNIGSILVTSLIFFILFTGTLGMGPLNLAIAVPCAALTVYYAKSLLPYLGGAAAMLGLAGAYFGWQGTAAANIARGSVLTPATTAAQPFPSPTASAPQLPQEAPAFVQSNDNGGVNEFINSSNTAEHFKDTPLPSPSNFASQETDQLLEEFKALENKNPPPSGPEATFESAWNNNNNTPLAQPNHPWVSEYLNCDLNQLNASIPKEQLKTYNEIWDSLQGPGFDIQNPASRQLLAQECQNKGLSWAQEFTNEKTAASFPWGKVATYAGGALMIAGLTYGGWKIYEHCTTETEKKEQSERNSTAKQKQRLLTSSTKPSSRLNVNKAHEHAMKQHSKQQSNHLDVKNAINSVQQPTFSKANTSLNRNGERLNTQEPTETDQNTSAASRHLEILTKHVVLERISPTAQYLQQVTEAPLANHTTSNNQASTNIDLPIRRFGILAGHINSTYKLHSSSSEITTVN